MHTDIDMLQHIHNFIYALLGTICLFTAIFSLIIRYQTAGRKKAIFLVQFGAFVMLIADLVANLYKGNPSNMAWWSVRISNFLVFFCLYVELLGLSCYIYTFISEKRESLPIRLKFVILLSLIGIAMLIVSQFNGMYYYFDDSNMYFRGSGFYISYIVPVAVYIIIISAIWKFRKEFPVIIFSALMFFAVLPLVSSVVQGIFAKLSLFDMSIGLSAMIIFIFSLVDQNHFLRKVACTEKMTGLPNSHGFMEEMGRKIASRTINNYNAFYFDIVRMGLINRKYGSNVGDAVIVQYVNAILENMKDDEVLGRLGGNYFTALVRKDNTDQFLDMLSGIDITVDTPMGGEVITMSAVAGVYEIDMKANGVITPMQILTNVSMAVNVAKNILKKPYVFLTQELQNQLNEQRQLQEMIPKCMALREFVPYYQPKVDISNNMMSGAEALVRWEHEGQIIYPGRFIPMMEQNESICKFDFYMLDFVCSDIKEWISRGLNPPVISINFSRKNLSNSNLAEDIYNVVKKHDIPMDKIQIEITETVDEYPLSQLRSVVEALQGYGMTTAIDDFGTGSSSIKLMKEVPFNVLKIDKSFIDSTSEKDCKILGYIIKMAKSMDANVITEGVEHKEQIEILKELGCREIQGYYFDKPLSKDMFEQRMANPIYG